MLSTQVEECICGAIKRGVFSPGDCIPGVRGLADMVGVSEKTTRTALANLAKTGWIRPVRGIGSVVTDRFCGCSSRGRVLLYLVAAGGGYYITRLTETLRDCLEKTQYQVLTVVDSPHAGSLATRRMESLLGERWSIVLENGASQPVRGLIERSGLPFIVFGDREPSIGSVSENCVGRIHLRGGLALPRFVHECVRKGVRSVVQFSYGRGTFSAQAMLEVACIRSSSVRIPYQRTLEGISRAGMKAVDEFLRRNALPDVILFVDDYVAAGGLLSLARHGIRVPEDVRVVSDSNKGHGLVWPVPVTCIEMDPVAHGKAMARQVLAFLRNKEPLPCVELGSVWKAGRTF